jgi:hypothetical protein
MGAFLRGKGRILWDVTVDTGYVQPMDFLTLGSRDRFDANNKVVDYLFRALCQPEFDRVHAEHLACRIWTLLKEAHVGNAQVQARMYVTYRREYENFTHVTPAFLALNKSRVRSRRACPGWACTYKGSRRVSGRHPRKVESRSIPTEELRRQEEACGKLQSERFCLPQGFTYPRDSEISSARKIGPSVHWTL